MAVTHVASTQAEQRSQGISTVVISKPTGTTSGDLLILTATCSSSGESITVSGFTSIAYSGVSFGTKQVFWKIAGASEPSTYTVTFSGFNEKICSLTCIRGKEIFKC